MITHPKMTDIAEFIRGRCEQSYGNFAPKHFQKLVQSILHPSEELDGGKELLLGPQFLGLRFKEHSLGSVMPIKDTTVTVPVVRDQNLSPLRVCGRLRTLPDVT
jgi:hypothetical protein